MSKVFIIKNSLLVMREHTDYSIISAVEPQGHSPMSVLVIFIVNFNNYKVF